MIRRLSLDEDRDTFFARPGLAPADSAIPSQAARFARVFGSGNSYVAPWSPISTTLETQEDLRNHADVMVGSTENYGILRGAILIAADLSDFFLKFLASPITTVAVRPDASVPTKPRVKKHTSSSEYSTPALPPGHRH